MRRKRFARWALALRRWRALRPDCGFLSRQFILARSCFQFFEMKLHLLQKPRLTLRAAAVKRAPQLLDLEPQMSDHRIRTGARSISPSFCGKAGGALSEDHRVSGGKIGGKSIKGRGHPAKGS